MVAFFQRRKHSDHPHYPIDRIRTLAGSTPAAITIEPRALEDARRQLPDDVAAHEVISDTLLDLDPDEFEYRQSVPDRTWADVYRIDFENDDYYLKIKIEPHPITGSESVVVLSFKHWVD